MGDLSALGRRMLVHTFETMCGDVASDGTIPFSIVCKAGEVDIVHGEVRVAA